MTRGLIVCDGNSLTAASYGAFNPYPAVLDELLGFRYNVINVGVGGQTTQQMTADGVAQVDALYAAGHDCNICVPWEVRNDFVGNSLTPAQAVANYWTYCDARQSAGWEVVAVTVLPSDGVASADLATINAAIRADYASHADVLADVAADARLADNSNADYFISDTTHLSNAGLVAVAETVAAAMASLLPAATSRKQARSSGKANGMTLSLIVGSGANAVDLVAAGLVDPDDVEDSDCEHGFESCEFAIRNQGPHLRTHNALTEGAAVKVVRDGVTTFEGEVVVIDDGGETHEVQCAGLYEQAKRREDFAYNYIDTRTEKWHEVNPAVFGIAATKMLPAQLDTTDGVLINIPAGTDYESGWYYYVVYELFDSLETDATVNTITALKADISQYMSGFDARLFFVTSLWGDQTADSDMWTEAADGDTRIYTGPTPSFDATAIVVELKSTGAGPETFDQYVQLRNISVKSTASAQDTFRLDELIADILVTDGPASASDNDSIGSDLASFTVDPFITRVDTVERLRALYSGIIDVGIWEDETLKVRVRPTAPDNRTRHYCLTSADLASPDDWGIARDVEHSIDAILCRYEVVPANWIVTVAEAASAPVSATGTWATDSPGWTQSHANATAQDYGSSQFYWRIRSNATNRNTNMYTDKEACTAGDRFIARARAKCTAYPGSGAAFVIIQFLDDEDAYVAPNLVIKSFAAAATTETWYEATGTVPAGATQWWARLEWYGVTGGASDYDLCVRDIEFRPVTPAGTPCTIYYPSAPSANDARVVLLDVGQATDAEAAAAAQQVYTYTNQLSSGSVPLDADHLTARYGSPVVPTVDGALVPIHHIRSWDWVSCVDAIDSDDRGPFMLSRVERTANGVTIDTGGDYWQHPGFTHTSRQRKYVGARQVRQAYWAKKKVKGKVKRVKKYRWVEQPGRYV